MDHLFERRQPRANPHRARQHVVSGHAVSSAELRFEANFFNRRLSRLGGLYGCTSGWAWWYFNCPDETFRIELKDDDVRQRPQKIAAVFDHCSFDKVSHGVGLSLFLRL